MLPLPMPNWAGRVASGGGGTPAPISAIAADGWQATIAGTPPAEFDPVGDPQTFTVARQGFNASGGAVTVNDTITLMKRVRQPYPNQASLTADAVALSDFVYADDVISGVTNNSARAYPKPIAHWLTPDRRIVQASSMTVQLAVAHGHARSGRPVAAVKFTVTDGTTTAEATVSAMTSRVGASGLHVPCFEGVLDISGMTQGAELTVDAVIYPWVGAAFTISTDASAYPNPNLTVLKALCDRTGAFGTAYVYVDASAGNDGTGVVSATPATAEANPYQNLNVAAAAIKTFNNANFGRNEADGGIIRLVAGTHTIAAQFRTTANTTAWPLAIEAANPANKATTILQDRGSSLTGSIPAYMDIRNITLRRSGAGSFVFLDTSAGSGSYATHILIDACDFDENGAGGYGAWLYKGHFFFRDCTGENCGQTAITGVVNKTTHALGCAANFASGISYMALGCIANSTLIYGMQATAAKAAGVGQLLGWNFVQINNSGSKLMSDQDTCDDRGHAAVYNILEQSGGLTSAAMDVYADSDTTPTQNIVRMGNTVVGARTNMQYQDIGTATVAKSGYDRFNAEYRRNTKTDVFGANANLNGNWPVSFRVGGRSNATLIGSDDGSSTPGTGVWLGEVAALGDVNGSAGTPLDPDWADDQSSTLAGGAGGGGGDYTPGASTELPAIPAGLAPYAIDQNGTAIANDGSALIGALQP